MKRIPNNLIQFWHDKSTMPGPFKVSHEQTMRTYPGYNEIFADDRFASDLIKQDAPYLSEFYEHNRIPSSRGDMARLALLYRYGGLMVDMSMAFHRPIWDRCKDDNEIVLVRRDDFPEYKNCPEKAHVIGGIIALPAKSRFMALCLRKVHSNLTSGALNNDVWNATGPGVLNQILPEVERDYKIRFLSFTDMKKTFFVSRRVSGFSNAWTQQQEDGIFEEGFHFNRQSGSANLP